MMKRSVKLTLTGIVLLLVVQLGFYLHATTSSQWEYAKRALACSGANYDLRYCMDLPAESRHDFTNDSWKPLPCINTATSLYNYEYRAGNCNKFMQSPSKWGFREVDASEAVPGDLMLFIRKKDGARHAGIYTMNSIFGPLCANTVVGGFYAHFMPIKPILALRVMGFYTVKYYRYNK